MNLLAALKLSKKTNQPLRIKGNVRHLGNRGDGWISYQYIEDHFNASSSNLNSILTIEDLYNEDWEVREPRKRWLVWGLKYQQSFEVGNMMTYSIYLFPSDDPPLKYGIRLPHLDPPESWTPEGREE